MNATHPHEDGLRTYRICLLGGIGQVLASEIIRARSDNDALVEANRRAKRHPVMVWDNQRLVGSLAAQTPGGMPAKSQLP